MKKDILFPAVEGIKLAVTRNSPVDTIWEVHIINENDFPLEGVIVVSQGYGYKADSTEKQKTSTLRHLIDTLAAKSTALVEPLDANLLHLFNEYWVSYYVNKQIYDKKFIFVPESIVEKNLVYIPILSTEGILHS
jgi:hypothetical protein